MVSTSTPPSARPSAMALLERGIPLSLLLDLVLGPDSEGALRDEEPRAAAS